MAPIRYTTIHFSSLFYGELIDLRQAVLRTPLGRSLEFEQTKTDPTDWHLGALHQARLVGIVSLMPLDRHTIRMRQMAVSTHFRGLGIGYGLVKQAEGLTYKKGFRTIILDARETAMPFYHKLAYETAKGPFTKTGIPHYQMLKKLESASR